MADLYLALSVLAVLSVTAFLAASWIASRLSVPVNTLLSACVVGLTFWYVYAFYYSVRLVEFLPFSSLIVLGNWLPLLSALLGGLVWRTIPGGSLRKAASVTALSGVSLATLVGPLIGSAPSCGDLWTGDGRCLQTTPETCSAACAATVLRAHGIVSTEQEMARLCLTRQGTTWQGLYRGLKLKTRNTPWQVRVLDVSADDLMRADGPLILSVGLEENARIDAGYELESGWKPGLRHSVVMTSGRSGHFVEIIDPNPRIGRERWTTDDLRFLYRGPALQLVPRTAN